MTDTGAQQWYEVVYYGDDDKWNCYAGSDTFKDGEQVARWRYADEAISSSTVNNITITGASGTDPKWLAEQISTSMRSLR